MPTPSKTRNLPMNVPTRRQGRRISRRQWRRQNARRLRHGRERFNIMAKRLIETHAARMMSALTPPSVEIGPLSSGMVDHGADALMYGLSVAHFDGQKLTRLPLVDYSYAPAKLEAELRASIRGALFLDDLFKPRGGKG